MWVLVLQEFCFKQLRKVEFGDPGVPSGDRVSLLACSSLYSLTFVATRTGQCPHHASVVGMLYGSFFIIL